MVKDDKFFVVLDLIIDNEKYMMLIGSILKKLLFVFFIVEWVKYEVIFGWIE